MKRILWLTCLMLVATKGFYAQDTTKTKLLNHEIGFNTVYLVKQLISNNPSSSLGQLPYGIFYNLYYQDRFGLRIGAGINNSSIETEIKGEPQPRTTDRIAIDVRAGGSYNFVKTGRLTLNAFADFVYDKTGEETVTTTTIQSFPNPITQQKTVSSFKVDGTGVQAGVGVKFNVYRQLSVYAEVPVLFMTSKMRSSDSVTRNGITDESSTSSKSNSTSIFLPTTIYLVLRF